MTMAAWIDLIATWSSNHASPSIVLASKTNQENNKNHAKTSDFFLFLFQYIHNTNQYKLEK